jgi:glucose 1-dehydrogenase
MSLGGKVALVTGAGRGIGKGCAIELARRGANIALNDLLEREEVELVEREIRRLGRQVITVRGNVSDRQTDRRLIETTVSELGRLDILVNNAGRTIRKPFLELTEEDVATVWGIDLWGVFHCSQFAARQMVSQGGGGTIVIISSVHASMPYKGSLPYTTAKAGISHMGRVMANELAQYRIRVNVIEPGWTDTPGERNYATEEEIRSEANNLPLGRLATIEDIGKGVAFLVSDEAGYITGTTLQIDGGLVLPRPPISSWRSRAVNS